MIIRGGLSLPRPTARNMPIPSSAARSVVDDVDPQAVAPRRPRCASSARTSGLTSLEARFDRRPGQVGALADDDPAGCGGLRPRHPRRWATTRMSSSRTGGVVSEVVAGTCDLGS